MNIYKRLYFYEKLVYKRFIYFSAFITSTTTTTSAVHW